MNPNAAASIAATVVPIAAPVTPALPATPVVVAIVLSGVDMTSPFSKQDGARGRYPSPPARNHPRTASTRYGRRR